ncbi:MAG: hypothetical protein A2059_00080 [Ignavibacteria bacterium GWA2_55_25]|nr:MAG: hypothetical protein A2059_00080 [Ignavibacteria bacterium GWA2_55_25]
MLREPRLSASERRRFIDGMNLFNRREFWEAHEAWEEVWQNCGEESRIFFQGIIQAAAAYHLILVKKRFVGARNNIDKSLSKLELFSGRFLGVDVDALRSALLLSREAMERLGAERLHEFPERLFPRFEAQGGEGVDPKHRTIR